jgi:hypothetical protein
MSAPNAGRVAIHDNSSYPFAAITQRAHISFIRGANPAEVEHSVSLSVAMAAARAQGDAGTLVNSNLGVYRSPYTPPSPDCLCWLLLVRLSTPQPLPDGLGDGAVPAPVTLALTVVDGTTGAAIGTIY